jgi:hypothetical protein
MARLRVQRSVVRAKVVAAAAQRRAQEQTSRQQEV